MRRLGTIIVSHPRIIIAFTLIITLAAAAAICIKGLGFNGSLETLAQDNDDLRFYKETSKVFGDDRVIVIGLTGQDVFTRDFISTLDRLTSTLGGLDGVAEVQSLTNVKSVNRVPDGLVVEKLLPRNAT